MKLYTVTTIRDVSNIRTPVICSTLANADNIIRRNALDIHETYYHYAMIEEIDPDFIYPMPSNEWWYEWDGTKYEPCAKPERFDRISGWGIG